MNQREKFEAWLRSIWTPGYDCRRGPGGDSYAHREAQNYWEAWQAALAASGGNAAPELTDEQIDEICNAQEAKYGQLCDTEDMRMFARAIEAASAPNAALVAALKMAVTQNECDMLMTGEECRQCRAALSAAGQEVKP